MKQLYTLVALLFMFTLGAYAQSDNAIDVNTDEFGDVVITQSYDTTNVEPKTVKKTDSYRDHFTVGLKGGITYFYLKSEQTSPEKANGGRYGVVSDISHEFSIFSEYLFDYGLGVGAYFGNYSYNRQAVLGTSIEFGIYSHMSLLECLSWRKPLPISRRLHIIWDAGLGVSALWQINQIVGDPSSDKAFWNPYAVVRTALQFEFMFRPHWGLMLEGEYHGYGRPNDKNDNSIYSSPWIHAGMLSGGIRYYFDNRKKEPDPKLDENDLPIREPRKPREVHRAPKNAVYVNVSLTPEMIEEAMRNNGNITIRASELGSDAPASAQVSPMRQSNDINSALSTLAEQGVGTVLINSIEFDNNQLTDGSMDVLDEIAGSLMSNQLWQKVELLYMSDKQASEKASLIATYLRAKGVKNLSVKGVTSPSEGETSDLIISIK